MPDTFSHVQSAVKDFSVLQGTASYYIFFYTPRHSTPLLNENVLYYRALYRATAKDRMVPLPAEMRYAIMSRKLAGRLG